jgi:hypothetical protein
LHSSRRPALQLKIGTATNIFSHLSPLINLGQDVSNFHSRLVFSRKFKGLALVAESCIDNAVKNFDEDKVTIEAIAFFAIKLTSVERVEVATSCCTKPESQSADARMHFPLITRARY